MVTGKRFRLTTPILGVNVEDRPQVPAGTIMEAYKQETRKIIRRFLFHNLSFPTCISRLDAALAHLIPRLEPHQLGELRAVMLANNQTVMAEMEKRPLSDLGKND